MLIPADFTMSASRDTSARQRTGPPPPYGTGVHCLPKVSLAGLAYEARLRAPAQTS
ncbi:hypothetical protein L1I79_03085 [Strepomyces sp. STD 3.1]|nr:hypothetical protein [Streptomyces sp. STD 3.1]